MCCWQYTDVGYQQPVGRSPFQELSRSLRVIPSWRSPLQGVCTVVDSPDQHLCIIPKSPSPTVVQHHTSPIVNVHQLSSGELNTIQDLRIPSHQSHPADTPQDKERQRRWSDCNTSLLALLTVVQSLSHLLAIVQSIKFPLLFQQLASSWTVLHPQLKMLHLTTWKLTGVSGSDGASCNRSCRLHWPSPHNVYNQWWGVYRDWYQAWEYNPVSLPITEVF